MDPHKANSLIYRISSGKQLLNFAGITYTFCQPSFSLQHSAQMVYDEIVYTLRFDNWVTEDQCMQNLITSGLLDIKYKDNIKELNKNLDNHKVNLYKNFFNAKQQEKIRSYIYLIYNKLNDIYATLSSLEHLTLHGFASICRQEYILLHSIYLPNGDLAFENNKSFALLNSLLNLIDKNALSPAEYRQLARHYLWRDIWRTSKNSPFPDFKYYTEEQRNLHNFSKMYDMVYESMESPQDEIIEDDDALDGWFVLQRREIEDHRKEKRAEKFSDNKHGNAQELYLVANTEEDRKRIAEMNTGQAKLIKRQREAAIKKQGKVSDGKLPDKQMENLQRARQAYVEHAKGKKG